MSDYNNPGEPMVVDTSAFDDDDLNPQDEEKVFKPIPIGQYFIKIDSIKDKISNNTGDRYWGVAYKVVSGEHEGRIVFDNLYFSPASIKRLSMVFTRIGGIRIPKSSGFQFHHNMLLGRYGKINVKMEKGTDDVVRNKIAFGFYRLTVKEMNEIGHIQDYPCDSGQSAAAGQSTTTDSTDNVPF